VPRVAGWCPASGALAGIVAIEQLLAQRWINRNGIGFFWH
jgi:Ni,Fe-hydrogenase I large subunit